MGGPGGQGPPKTKKVGAKVSFAPPKTTKKYIKFRGFQVIFIWETQNFFACGALFLANDDFKPILV